jgi:hypothetical protein
VTSHLSLDRTLWRVGYHADPLAFTPPELYAFNHRFDDLHHRFRTLYCAEFPETALREVLADFRPNLAAQRRHIERYGPEAAQDFVAEPVTAQWRSQHVLVPVTLQLDGPLIDLTDVPTRQEVEDRHLDLLLEYGLQHLDLPEITTRRRPITQTIAADLVRPGCQRRPLSLQAGRQPLLRLVRGPRRLASGRRPRCAHRPAAPAADERHGTVAAGP